MKCKKTLAVIGAAAVALLVLFIWNPAAERFFPPCPVNRFTGLYCAGCGSLRALHQLLHGHVFAAFRYNPLLVVSLPFLAALVLRPRWGSLPWVPWAAFIILVAYSILRNVPVWPFTLLAPCGV